MKHTLTSLIFSLACIAQAQTVTITTPTTVNIADTSIAGVPLATADIVVEGTTLTINGAHTINSLVLRANATNQPAVLTHGAGSTYTDSTGATAYGLELNVLQHVHIAGGSSPCSIDLNGRGFAVGQGPGSRSSGGGGQSGASHGGRGGTGSAQESPACYGSFENPTIFGSGSPPDCASGHRGGGALRLNVGGTLTVDGLVRADAGIGGACASGGASGGSVRIDAFALAGSGVISADGGHGFNSTSGGGGGGRVAVFYQSSSFEGIIRARGGFDAPTASDARRGGAGTVWIKPAGSSGTLILDNDAVDGATSDISGVTTVNGSVVLLDGAAIGHELGVSGTHLIVTGDLTIGATAGFDVSGRGFTAGVGPGSYVTSRGGQAGAGHGGRGGDGSGILGGACYGSMQEPTTLGSGGPPDCNSGGRGGGAIRVSVGGNLSLDGTIQSDAITRGSLCGSGGAAGGSIFLEAGSFSGSGVISANGARSNRNDGGGGGGGRIAVYFGSSTFTGSIQAYGGDTVDGYLASRRGGAGTVWLKPTGQLATLVIDNGGFLGQRTDFTGEQVIEANLLIDNAGALSHPRGVAGTWLTFAGDVTIETDGRIDVDGRGNLAGEGFGSTSANTGGQGGAGHGGRGGEGANASGGSCHGSPQAPVGLGSGGVRDCSSTGAIGGGALRISCAGALNVLGEISADGSPFGALCGSTGSSGGSLFLECGQFMGNGVVSANGSVSNRYDAGGGGGGRIAVYYNTSTFTGSVEAFGGNAPGTFNSARRGGAGTIWLAPSGSLPTMIIDNGGIAGQRTDFVGEQTFESNLLIDDEGALSHPAGVEGTWLTFSGNITIESDGRVDVDGRGFGPGEGPGSRTGGGGGQAGAGHGGRGGDGNTYVGGTCYGSIDLPTDLGSGSPPDCGTGGARGGGALRLSCGGDLTVNGEISSDGSTIGAICGSGGASGGSLFIESARLLGFGVISADGAVSARLDSGGGGGGRIAVYTGVNSFAGTIRAYGATAPGTPPPAARRAGAGTVWIQESSSRADLIIDNGGNRHQTTDFRDVVALDANLRVRAGGVLSHPEALSGTALDVSGDVVIESGGAISLTGRGYPKGQGPGTNSFNSGGQGGAGHGGRGGRGSSLLGGAIYGSETAPIDLGSGGGMDCGSATSGGGALRLFVGGTLSVDGELSSDGGTVGAACSSGGASGGSLWIRAGSLEGSGSIRANGGSGSSVYAGGGGGGRIAIYTCDNSMSPANIQSAGGAGYTAGGAGTVFFGGGTVDFLQQPTDITYLSGILVELEVEASTSQVPSTLTYQWRRRDRDGDYLPLIEGYENRIFGTNTPILSISEITCTDGGYYDCLVSDSCGSFPSLPAFVSIQARADYDGTGTVDGDDIIAFFADWDASNSNADFNDDGGVDGDDVIAFFAYWDRSC